MTQENTFDFDAWLSQKPQGSNPSAETVGNAFDFDQWLNTSNKDVADLGTKQAEDFNTQLAQRHLKPVEAYQQMENYRDQMANYYGNKGYSQEQIKKMLESFTLKADPRNVTSDFEYYLGDRWPDAMIGVGNLMTDALAAVPESIPILGGLADEWEHQARAKKKAWENDVSAKAQINQYLENKAYEDDIASGSNEFMATLRSIKDNPMQVTRLITQQAPQLLLGLIGKGAVAGINIAGGAGRVRNEVEQAYDKTLKENPEQLLNVPEIQMRLAQGMTLQEAVEDAKKDISDNIGHIALGAAIGGTEALTPTANLGRGVSRGVVKTFAKEGLQEGAQEGGEQLNTNLAVGHIDGKTKPLDQVVRNTTLGTIVGTVAGTPAAIEAGLNRNHPTDDLVSRLDSSAQQGQQANARAGSSEQTQAFNRIDEQALEKITAHIEDEAQRSTLFEELKSDIEDGLIQQRIAEGGNYGALAQAYLNETGQSQATQSQTITDPVSDPVQAVKNPQDFANDPKYKAYMADMQNYLGNPSKENAQRIAQKYSPEERDRFTSLISQQFMQLRPDVAQSIQQGASVESVNQMLKGDQTDLETQAEQTLYSRSPMKSVEANIARGRERMTQAILNKADVKRGMYNNEFGWVDFVWGDDGLTKTPNKNGEPKGKGISHIFEARARKNGMNEQQATDMLVNEIVETIAKGTVVNENPKNKLEIDYRSPRDNKVYRATLTRNKGNNAWLLTAFDNSKKYENEGAIREGKDISNPTIIDPTLTRADKGASLVASGSGQFANSQLNDTHAHSQRGRGVVAENGQTVTNIQTEVNSQIAQDQQTLSRILGAETASHIEIVDSNTIIPTGQDVKKLVAKGVEGWFDGKTQKLYLISENIEASRVLSRDERLAWVAWHELAHAGVRVKFGGSLKNLLASARQHVVVSVLARRIAKEHGYDSDVATEEAMMELFSAYQTGKWAELESRYKMRIHESWKSGKDNVRDHLTKLANLFRRVIGVITGRDLTQTMTTKEVFETLRGIERGIQDLAKTNQNSTARDVRYSLNENADSEFATAVDNFVEGNEVKTSISLGTTPNVLKMVGLPDVEVKIKRKVLSKVMRGKHAIEPETLKQLPQQMNNPVGVLRSSQNSSNPNGYVVLTELTEHNAEKGVDEPVIAALHLTKSGDVEILGVASAYGKEHSKLQEMLNEDEVLYWNKTKGSQLANVHWLQLPLKLRSNANLSSANIKTELDLSQYRDENADDEIRYSFAGEKAKTANHSLLEQAKADIANGVDPEIVRQQTGWFNGNDGKWRFELDDSQIQFKGYDGKSDIGTFIDPDLSGRSVKLGELIDAEALFSAYPDLAEMDVIAIQDNQYGGYYSPSEDIIAINYSDFGASAKSTLLHEIQHAIQERENFAKGGGESQFTETTQNTLYKNRLRTILMNDHKARELYQAYKNAAIAYENQPDNPQVQARFDELSKAVSANPQAQEAVNLDYLLLDEDQNISPREQYMRLAGEVEARNVQKRLNFDKQQRQNTPVWQTEDRYPSHQLIKFDHNGKAYQLNEEVNSEFAKAVDEVYSSDNNRIKEEWIELGTTPDALIQAGIDDLPMFMNKQKLGKIKNEHPEMTVDLLKQIPNQLNNPVVIFKNTKKGSPQNSYVILTELVAENGNPVIAAIHANRVEGGLELNKLASIYGRNEAKNYLANMAKYSDVRFVDKQKARQLQDTLQLLAPETLNELFDKASVVKDDTDVNSQNTESENNIDENADDEIRYSIKQSVSDLAKSGKAQKVQKYSSYKDFVEKVVGKVDEWVTDGLRPVNDWIDKLPQSGIAAHEAAQLKHDMYRAKGVRDALNSELEANYLKPIIQKVANIAKANKLDELSAKRLIGFWVSGRYAIEKNNELLQREHKAMVEAEKALNDAKANGTPSDIDHASREYRTAERQYRYRKHDVELPADSTEDFKVGTAGGWSNAEAESFMRNIETHIPTKQLEEAAELIYNLNQARLKMDWEARRYTAEQYKAYKANRHYVPLTGNPYSINEVADMSDSISGAGQNAVNVSKDRALKGRKLSEAEDGIDASWRAINKSTTYFGWNDFKNRLDELYENTVADLKNQGKTDREAKAEASEMLGISKQKLQGLTHTSDDVLIRKLGNDYYEYRLPDNVIKALKNDNMEHANDFLKVISTPTSWYARGVTQWTLTFAPMNMLRDTWEKSEFIRVQKLYDQNGNLLDGKTMDKIGRATLKFAVAKDTFAAVKRFAFGQTLRDSVPAEKALKELLDNGGVSTYSTYFAKTETDLIKQLERENSAIRKRLDKAGTLLENYNKMFDTVSALAAYRALRDQQIDVKQAAGTTLELTNFRKTGSKMRGIKALYMFSQPTAMGARNLLKYLSTPKGRRRFTGYMIAMMAIYSALRAIDDEDEGGNLMDQLGDITRYIPLPLGLGKYFKLPVGFGMPQMAWNFAVNLVKAGNNDISVSEAATNMLTHSLKTFAPVSPSEISAANYPLQKLALTFTPTMLQPLMQNALDRSAFGSKITPSFIANDKLKAEQSKSTTAKEWKELALWINDKLGFDMHPEQIKNLVDGYSSMFGSLKEVLTVFIENPNREQLGRRTRTPFLNQFIGTTNEFAIQSRYYEASSEAEAFATRYQSRQERGIRDQLTREERQMLSWHELNKKRMSELRSEKSKLTRALRNGTMSEATYEARLKIYNQRVDNLQRVLLKRWREMNGLSTN